MTSTPPGGRRPSNNKGTPPMPTRRSARQERIAARQAGRGLERAGTQRGTPAVSMFMVITIAAVLIGVGLLGAAVLLQKSNQPATIASSPNPPAANLTTPTDVPWNGTTLGKPDAKVTLDIWSDFQCPNCGTFTREYEPKLVEKYVRAGDVKIVYRDLLVIDMGGGGTESHAAANAARCAADQNKFWLMHDWLFANQMPEKVGGSGAYTTDRLIQIGREAGLDMSKFEPCVRNGQHLSEIDAEKPPAELAAHPQTPTFYVNGQRVEITSSYSDIDAVIDQALGKANPSPSASAS